MNDTMIELKNIEKYFGGVHALKGVSLQIPRGQVTSIIGDNGAGKSTLIKCVSGMHTPTSGEIFVDGKSVKISSPRESRHLGIETVYQDLAVIDTLTVRENLYLSREIQVGFWPLQLLNRKKMTIGAKEMLAQIGNKTINVNHEIGGMSGGQRQAVAICRAVAWGAQVVIFDEPTAALGVNESAEVHDLILMLREKGITVILISHNFEEVMALSDLVWVMRQGRAIASRKTSETTGRELVALLTGAEIAA
ncbi:MAG: sugar ABC transporter ATP-binding protein [Candidatus Saccharibacteria bacterium]|nr:sugar ABC transporter ATP-binding protein [Microbacteriaceae bacterium]